ncbi:unnamed protein product [Calypogeia fissa]
MLHFCLGQNVAGVASSSSSLLRSLGSGFGPKWRVSCASVPERQQFNASSNDEAAGRLLHNTYPHGLKSGRVSKIRKAKGDSEAAGAAEIEGMQEEEKKSSERRRGGSAFKCVSRIATAYNQIVILEAPEKSTSQYAGCRVLLLDNSGNVHSVYNRNSVWTGLYWDEFASLPAIIPKGRVALLGLGGGTAVHLLLKLWPSLQLEGYEIDEIIVEQARLHLGLSDLEIPTSEGGCLTVHVGDALSPLAAVDGGFAGIIVDLFSEGGVVGELQQAQTWLNLQKKLRPGGRIMVNCGGICVEKGDAKTNLDDGTWTWEDGGATKDATLLAMAAAFQGQVNWRKMDSEADNCLALSGPLPDLESWAAAVPERLKEGITTWRPYV